MRGLNTTLGRLSRIALVVALSAGVGAAAYYVAPTILPRQPAGDQPASNGPGGPSLVQYPAGWTEIPLTKDDIRAGILLQLRRSAPEAAFLVRGIVGTQEQKVDLAALARQTEESLRREISGASSFRNSVVTIGRRELVYINYVQAGQAGGPFLNDLYILPTPRQTFYFSLRSSQAAEDTVRADKEQILRIAVEVIDSKLGN